MYSFTCVPIHGNHKKACLSHVCTAQPQLCDIAAQLNISLICFTLLTIKRDVILDDETRDFTDRRKYVCFYSVVLKLDININVITQI
jgi:hypothetical protein